MGMPQLPVCIAGHPALDLVNTVDWTESGPVNDYLTGYDHFTRWAEAAGVVSKSEGESLRRIAGRDPAAARRVLAHLLHLRDILQHLFSQLAVTRTVPARLERFHPFLAEALRHARLEALEHRRGGPGARWTWDDATGLTWPLWSVVRHAADLLASADTARVRRCDGDDCGWLFVDRSRNRLRRWCRMETCGTREKNRRRSPLARAS